MPFGVVLRKNAQCPKCLSVERHRLYYLYLSKILPKEKITTMLHVSPEKCFHSLFSKHKNIKYTSIDIDKKKAMMTEDITDLSFPKKHV